jgi:hypothetical protein
MAKVSFFERLANLWRGFISLWISDVERKHPEIAYENAINSMIEKFSKLKRATAAIIRRREELEQRAPDQWRRWRVEGFEGWEGGERYVQAMERVAGAVAALAEEWPELVQRHEEGNKVDGPDRPLKPEAGENVRSVFEHEKCPSRSIRLRPKHRPLTLMPLPSHPSTAIA